MKKYLMIGLALSLSGCVSSSKHKELQAERDALQARMAEQKQTTDTKISEQSKWIAELENRIGKNRSELSETRKALEELAKRKLEAEKRIQEYRELTRKFKSLVDSGRLSVKLRDGRMVVALSTDILFNSGSARLSSEGSQAIKEVTGLLITIPNRQFQVEGHTDNMPIKTAQFPSNWELAAARAMTVTSVMLEAGMPGERLSAASFGDTKPFQPNETKEGRAANRRIEIAIIPDLSSLPGYDELNQLETQQ